MTTTEKLYDHECAHIPCGCEVANDGDYCSDWCKKEIGSTDCGCGHTECRAEA